MQGAYANDQEVARFGSNTWGINGMVIPYLISEGIAGATTNGKVVRFYAAGKIYNSLIATDSSTTN